MIYGHYHKNELAINDNVNCINLGSLSIPKDNHHSYAVLENGKYISFDLFSDEILLEVNLDE